jgi:hypothetical protein
VSADDVAPVRLTHPSSSSSTNSKLAQDSATQDSAMMSESAAVVPDFIERLLLPAVVNLGVATFNKCKSILQTFEKKRLNVNDFCNNKIECVIYLSIRSLPLSMRRKH